MSDDPGGRPVAPGELTREEERWIASLQRVMKKRPETLGIWLPLTMHHFEVIALNKHGGPDHADRNAEYSQLYSVASVECPVAHADVVDDDFSALERPWVRESDAQGGAQ